jgi:hypothetical protein
VAKSDNLSYTLAVISLIFLAAFAAAGQRPDWLSGETAAYPKSRYILGIGEAGSQEKAADKARAEIAKAFGVSLSAKTESSMKEVGDAKSSSFSQSVEDQVRTSTARFLDGVEVVQYWRDDEGYHHALAVLDRAHNLKVLADKLAELDKDFAASADSFAKTEGKFGRLRLALKLLRAGRSRRRLNENYRVLNPEGKGVPVPERWQETLAGASKAVRAVTVGVEAMGQDAPRVASRVMDGLASYGLRAVEAGVKADVVVRLESSGQPLRPENITWFWARGTVAVKMSYGATGEVFKSFTETGQEAARDPGDSVAAALTALAGRAADHAYETLTSSVVLDD